LEKLVGGGDAVKERRRAEDLVLFDWRKRLEGISVVPVRGRVQGIIYLAMD
jgi:hypothetical protein